MENFGLFDLFNKILSQKQLFEQKKDDEQQVKKQVEKTKVSHLPTYYIEPSIVSLIKRHDKLSKQIDIDNKKP